jgi:hypothetical protein
MAVTQSLTALNSSTAVLLNPVTSFSHPVIPGQTVYSWNSNTLIIQNVDASATVYIGTSSVTSSAYGVKLAAGSSVSLDDLKPTEPIYAISSGSSSVSVLSIIR